jgi:probable rRNA maturation factor
MAPRISVRNLQRKTRVDSRQLQQFAALVLERCLALKSPDHSTLDSFAEINVLLVSNRRIAALHKRFLNHAGPTDVITFQHGEVFISTETARRHAKQFGTTMLHELQLYIIHGLLHLHGFDDQTAAGAKRMITTQERLLAQIAG